jgi:hypothetical protein
MRIMRIKPILLPCGMRREATLKIKNVLQCQSRVVSQSITAAF